MCLDYEVLVPAAGSLLRWGLRADDLYSLVPLLPSPLLPYLKTIFLRAAQGRSFKLIAQSESGSDDGPEIPSLVDVTLTHTHTHTSMSIELASDVHY